MDIFNIGINVVILQAWLVVFSDSHLGFEIILLSKRICIDIHFQVKF